MSVQATRAGDGENVTYGIFLFQIKVDDVALVRWCLAGAGGDGLAVAKAHKGGFVGEDGDGAARLIAVGRRRCRWQGVGPTGHGIQILTDGVLTQ